MNQHKGVIICVNIIVTIFLISLFLGCSGPPDSKHEIKEYEAIKIGAILPLTGTMGYLGEDEKKAIELAAKGINNKYNKEIIKVLFEDSKESPNEAETIANKLMNVDEVSAFVTSSYSISNVVLPIANKNKIIIAMLCTDPDIQKESPYAFRLYGSSAAEANQFLEYYRKTKERKKVVILFLNHPDFIKELTVFLIPGFMQDKIKVAYYEPYDATEKDFKIKVERLKHSGANSLLILGHSSGHDSLFKELARQGLLGKIEIAGGWGFIMPNNIPANLLEGTIVAGPKYFFLKNEKAKQFEESFRKEYGYTPDLDTTFAYNGMNILAEGLIYGLIDKKGNSDTVSRELINSMHDGVMGEVSIDTYGSLEVPMGLGIIRQGKIMPLLGEKF
jgi:branched-chain amino acid transport system substrate-binding protein